MSQDKLEEIARLLGGISDKLDAMTREQQRMLRLTERWDGDGVEQPKLRSRLSQPFKSVGYPPVMSQEDAVRAAEEARDSAQHAAALAHRVAFGDWGK